MRNRMIKAAVAVPDLKIGDVNHNVAAIRALLLQHSDCGLMVFPELCLTGYTCADLFGQSALLQAAEHGLQELALVTRQLPGLTAVVGLPLPVGNSLYNCAAFLSEGRICALVPKTYLPTYSEFYEHRWFASGRGIKGQTVRIGIEEVPFGTDILVCDESSGTAVGTDICEDLWVPDKPSTHACLAGANIIVNLSASDETIGKQSYRRQMVAQQSAACYCDYLYVSSATDESSTDLVFSGHSLIAENGTILQEMIYPQPDSVLTAILDTEKAEFNRRHQNTFATAAADQYRHIPAVMQPLGQKLEISSDTLLMHLQKENFPVAPNPFVPDDQAERGRRCAEILRIQANGLATRVKATGIHTLVIGISGGLDSTLALIVAHEAQKIVPAIRIIGYTLPNHGNTTDYTYQSAISLMQALQVESREVAIEERVKEHLQDIGHSVQYQGEGDVTYENAQARMRTYILMDAANMENGLVVGTGDLSELALGWCTYNGDHMSMYAVNAGVPKTLVRYIVTAYADTCGSAALHDVLHRIADTPITPELTPANHGTIAQKTEEKIGKYDLNDFFLFYTLRYGFSPDKILALAGRAYEGLDKETIRTAMERFYRRFFSQQFKRSCLPDGPKVGSVTLSPRGDWRMPSDASPALWLEILKNA